MAGSGVTYFPQVLGPNTVVGRLAPNPGPTEQIPFAQLAAALGIGGSNYLLATNIAGTNTVTGTVATAPALAANQVLFLIPANTNTGAVTFDRDAQGTPKSVFYNGAALVGGEIVAGVPAVWFYDGTQYNIVANGSASGNAASRGTVASATTTNLDTSSSLTQQITGTTTITGITLANGHVRIVEFSGILTLTNSASLILPGGTNIVTAAGDAALFIGEPAGVVRCVMFQKANALPGKQPTRTVLTSGTGATYTTPLGATRINVRLVGGGGSGATSGANGTNTTFGTLTGSAGVGAGAQGGAGGAGGAASGGDINIPGGNGNGAAANTVAGISVAGQPGGNSAFGGGGGGGGDNAVGKAAATNSGGGGGSDGVASATTGRPSGGAGGYVEKLIIGPSTTYTYTVGTGGAAGTGGQAGAAGIIIVDEWYN